MSLWSTVSTTPAKKPVKLTTNTGDSITLEQLCNSIEPLTNGYYYYQKLPLINGHLQTFAASAKNFGINVQHYGRRIFDWGNGCISVDYSVPENKNADKSYAPIENVPRPFPLNTRYLTPEEITERDDPKTTRPLLITVHGLAGGAVEPYIRATICKMQQVAPNFEHCVITSRGCNRSLLTTPQFFNACWTEDLRNLVEHVHERQPKRPIYLAGYSLGAGVVANYLGQEANTSKITAACIVAAPWDLNLSNLALNSSFLGRNLYSRVMASNLSRLTRYHAEILKDAYPYSVNWVNINTKTVQDYDENFTSLAFGFDSATDYYRNGSPVNRLRNIRTPSLVLNSKDDPICADASVPYRELATNGFTHTVSTTGGGHLGWFQADGKQWFANAVTEFFKAFNDQIDVLSPPHRDPPTERWFKGDRFVKKPVGDEHAKHM